MLTAEVKLAHWATAQPLSLSKRSRKAPSRSALRWAIWLNQCPCCRLRVTGQNAYLGLMQNRNGPRHQCLEHPMYTGCFPAICMLKGSELSCASFWISFRDLA